MDRQGKLNGLQGQLFCKINTEPWQTAREAFAFWEDDIVHGADADVTGMSEQAARNWFNGDGNRPSSASTVLPEKYLNTWKAKGRTSI